MLEDEEIFSIISTRAEISQKVTDLVNKANDNGGLDNISVVVVEPYRI